MTTATATDLPGPPATAAPPAAVCGTISALAVQLIEGLRSWCRAQGDEFRPYCVEATALCLAFSAPWSTAGELLVPATVSLWMTDADDRFDTRIATAAEAGEFARRCGAIAAGCRGGRGGRVHSADPLERSLAAIVGRLSELPGYAGLSAFWHERFQEAMAAQVFEWQVSHGRVAPSLEEYLGQGDSFLLGPICAAWWMSSAEAGLPGWLDTLRAAQQEASAAGRLANDLATVTRERAEGCRANALLLGAAPAWVRQRIGQHVARCHELLRPLTESGVRPAIALGRLTDWIAAFYQVTDARIELADRDTTAR